VSGGRLEAVPDRSGQGEVVIVFPSPESDTDLSLKGKTMATRRIVVLVPLFALGLLAPLRAWADCGNDNDCKDDRVCQNGTCVDRSYRRPDPPPPVYYAPPPPPGYYGDPPPRAPPPWAWPLHGSRSFGAIGGVGDFIDPATFGGITFEAMKLFRFFDTGNFDGGLTLNILDDFSFVGPRLDNPFYASVQGGVGFDFGLFKVLQFGPRFNVGYGSDLTGTLDLHGGFVAFGGHVLVWFNRSVGLYVESDTIVPFTPVAPNGFRFAGGLALSWD